MKTNNKLSAYILRGSTTALFFSCVIVALCSAINLPEQPPKARPPRGNAVFGANGPASVASMPASASDNARKSARFKFASSSQRVGGREIAGFSARQAPTGRENLIPPAGLKPVEEQAWLAMARQQEASGGMEFTSFYPARYNQPFVVQGEGVRVAVRPVGATDAKARIDSNGQVLYRGAYVDTDSVHAVTAGRSEEFLFLQDDCAPREFEYELSELSAGARVELVNGEVHFSE